MTRLEYDNGTWGWVTEEYLTHGQHVLFSGSCNYVKWHIVDSSLFKLIRK